MPRPCSTLERTIAGALAGDRAVAAARWAASGAMALTGPAGGPPSAAPARLALAMDALAESIAMSSDARVVVDGPALLGERAAHAGLERRGSISCGGQCRLLRAADGWIAVSLARPDDVASLAAWLETPIPPGGDLAPGVDDARTSPRPIPSGPPAAGRDAPAGDVPVARGVLGGGSPGAGNSVAGRSARGDGVPGGASDVPVARGVLGGGSPGAGNSVAGRSARGVGAPGGAGDVPVVDWEAVAAAVAVRPVAVLVERAGWLGMPVGAVGEAARGPLVVVEGSHAVARRPLDEVTVVDLSSLWAGPLCANLLGLAGARVIKVESSRRPDGARFGPAGFFDLLHGGHESVALDLSSDDGQRWLRRLLDRADVVIEASRPRALEAMGASFAHRRAAGWAGVWLSITAHPDPMRVGFGDDAAAAGGLVVHGPGGPMFCADAVADPLTGTLAAAVTLEALQSALGGRYRLSLAAAAAFVAAAIAHHHHHHAADAVADHVLAGDHSSLRRRHPEPSPDSPALAPGSRAAGDERRVTVAEPRSRPIVARAPALGADTDAVLGAL